MKKIVTVIGARPQFVKAGALSRLILRRNKLQEIIVHTGQHHDPLMSDIFFSELQIPKPHYALNINGLGHAQMTAHMMEAIDEVVATEKPDALLVYGDTNSTLAGALVASKLNIPVLHVEAGLRSFNKQMPEEINRILTDHVSAHLFCPTKASIENLKNEGITRNVHYVGDIMYDATLYAIEHNKNHPEIFSALAIEDARFAVLTIHRASSTESAETLHELLAYCNEIAASKGITIIFPIHPRTRKLLDHEAQYTHIKTIDPLGYFEMHALLSRAELVITDSGGLQKEAYFHKVECITLRTETEWVETIQHGWNRLWTEATYKQRSNIDDYGNGDTAERILSTFLNL